MPVAEQLQRRARTADRSQQEPPPGNLQQQLAYLNANPSAQYNEPGPDGGVPGIFLQFTREASLDYDVSIIAVSSATLNGYVSGTSKQYFSQIAQSKWNHVVLQDQSFEPLPSTITVNGNSVATRGNFANFEKGMSGLINGIDAADTAAGKSPAAVTMYQTQPLASYGFTSSNPAQPIFGSSTSPPGGVNAPYVGDKNPIAAMAKDLHNAYEQGAGDYQAAHPAGSSVNVALAGDAWVSAINLGYAEENPYLSGNQGNRVDLWDSDPLNACCTTPIGYHESIYGAYLNALVLFDEITGVDPTTLLPEFSAGDLGSAAYALGISPTIAEDLAIAAERTVKAGHPVPEPSSLLLLTPAVAILVLRRRARQTTK